MSVAAATPSAVAARSTRVSRVAVRSTRSFVSESPRRVLYSESTGTKACEKAPQQVGNAEGDEKSVGRKARAEQPRDQDVPNESENARYERHAAHGRERFEQIHAGIIAFRDGKPCAGMRLRLQLRPFVRGSAWQTPRARARQPARPRSGASTTRACARR